VRGSRRDGRLALWVGRDTGARATAAGSPLRNRMIAIPLRLAAARARQAAATGRARSLAAAEAVSRSGGSIGVYRPEDRLTPPALRRAAGDITSPRTGSSSLPCPRRPHELRGSTIPSRRSFFGFAPVDGAHSELTRRRAPLFPRSTQISSMHTVAWTLACSSTSPYSDHRCWRTTPSGSRRASAIGRSASRCRGALMSLANGVAPAAPAWRAEDRQRRNTDVG
jgi:hypothetical protein